MKYKILLLISMAIGMASFAQGKVKLYGFVQDTLAGTIPRGTDEYGKKISVRKPASHYFIYASQAEGSSITPVQVWIKGKAYNVSTQKTGKGPVMGPRDFAGKQEILIKKGRNNIIEITPVSSLDDKRFSAAKAKAQENELVLVYRLKGKYYSITQKKLKRLEPVNNE